MRNTKAEIICVGTEILLGQIHNTNARHISLELARLGADLYYHTVVGDNLARLERAFALAMQRSGIVVVTGGLGPTMDDITKEALARATGRKLLFDEGIWQEISGYFVRSGREVTDNNKRQALVIEGSTVLSNPLGTAPGLVLEHDSHVFFLLPGPPREMIPMFTEQVIPYLTAKGLAGREIIHSKSVRICGLGESAVEAMVSDIIGSSINPTVAPYAALGQVELRVTCKAASIEEAVARVDEVIARLKGRLGDHVFGYDDTSLEEALGERLKRLGWSVAVAESCTGGLLGDRLTNVPGSSEYFLGGIIAYSNQAKYDLLGVEPRIVELHGAVSEQCVLSMAKGVRICFGADVGVSISGIAGPGGGTTEKPVGTVYISIVTPSTEQAHRLSARPPRKDIKWRAAQQALTHTWLHLGEVLKEN